MRLKSPGRVPPGGTGERYFPLDPTNSVVKAHRALALAILSDYGNPATNEGKVSAIVDWVARTAVHSHYGIRVPTPYTRGTGTLPVGVTWAQVQATWTTQKQNDDNAYWLAFNHDGAAILAKLLGTLNADGTRANDGAMVRVTDDGSQAHYRYRDLASIKSVWCTHQHNIAAVLLASLGFPSMLSHITGHDPMRVQYGERGEWMYACCTYNEHYRQADSNVPLDLMQMRDLTQAGRVNQIVRVVHNGPAWDALPYGGGSYIADHPDGVPQMGVSLDTRIIGGIGARMTRVLDDPALTGSGHALENYTRTSDKNALPYLGAYVYGTPALGRGMTAVRVASGWPGTVGFQMRVQGGNWATVTATKMAGSSDLTCTVRVRDGVGVVEVAPVDANSQLGPAVELVA